MPDRPLDPRVIAAALGPLAVRFDVDVVAECDSTSALLLARAGQGAPGGSVVVAERQTAGRGRMGRAWVAEPGASLTFSLLWRLPRGVAPAGLSLAVGVAVAEALAQFGVGDIRLKWPNDVLRGGGKLGGILVDLAGAVAVIGVGLNLRLPAGLPEDVQAMAAALDHDVERNFLLAALLRSLHAVLVEFDAGGFVAMRERWLELNAHAGVPVRILSEFAAPLAGICAGVDADGALLLETAAGVRRIVSGDVSLRLP